MIWNAPIWLNEMLVNTISLLVGLMLFFLPILIIIIIVCFIKFLMGRRAHSKKLLDFMKRQSTISIIIIILVSSTVLGIFYKTQKVIPDIYSFSEISMESDMLSEKSRRISINDNEKLKEFKDIFRRYSCRRNLDNKRLIDSNTNTVYINMLIYSKNKSSPLNFTIGNNYSIRYTSGNTDFSYLIKDDNHELAYKIVEFYNKYKDSK